MIVDPQTARFKHDHGGRTYYFCAQGCLDRFAADPAKYLGERTSAPPVPDAVYTCPMHPEVRQTGPGACPKCGMALEPVEVTADETPNPELDDMSRRFRVSAALAVPLLIDRDGGHVESAALVRNALGRVGAGDAGGAVGRLAVLRTRLAVDRQPQSEHVHADRDRHRHGLSIQRDRNARAANFSGVVSRPGRRAGRVF